MKKSIGLIVAFYRIEVLLLGVVLCLAVFGLVTLKTGAQKESIDDSAVTGGGR